ncbi:M14 family zinc carboxypeptidase [Sphingobacterium psychroaquaticum]|uniref:M14 family zinc carboxypeptidase n=1 Tax=Sphingobacterium psychroaquaticum TaxID=561061 RepID=UPI00141B47B7|nr:M14 family zinc carboxypeptidase [Sphingobacterium psychroaquaticum]
MKKLLIFLLIFVACSVQGQDRYYYGDHAKFNPNIPTPEDFFGFPIGTALVRYDKVVEYFKLLAQKSDRAAIETIGYSWERREQIKLLITSPTNQPRLEDIRQKHLQLVKPGTKVAYSEQKIVVELAYNVHGGEIAGTDAAVLAAYYLVAVEDPDILRRLNEAVVLIEPSQNPDGRERAVTYINGFHSNPPVADPADIGHGGGWTPHRGNHFWNDLNRDWLALSQVESQNRVAYYHRWYPNVYLDFHEMGSSSSYYFEPSPLSTWNKILPQSNYNVLTAILAKQFSKALNKIGSLYFTKESFTNLSPIYGSTYPDYQGGVGVTLEVGATSGVAIETDAGVRTFARNLKDNFEISIAGLIAATDEKEVFLKEQKSFFESALQQADRLTDKYIIFGSKEDPSLNRLFLKHLLRHHIEVYALSKTTTEGGKTFEVGTAYVVPLKQGQFRILQSIFEENETNAFDKETTFYDISAWSTAHGYGIPFVKTKNPITPGVLIQNVPDVVPFSVDQSLIAYAFEYNDYLAAKALYFLQDKGVIARVASLPFTSKTTQGDHNFFAGTIVIPVAYQTLEETHLYQVIQEAATRTGISIHSINDGFSVRGIDLGSNNIRVLKKPKVGLVSGGNWTTFGEVWSLLSETYAIPVVKLNAQNLDRIDLQSYTSIILTGGQHSADFAQRLAAWVNAGGTLINLGAANSWVNTAVFPAVSNENNAGNRGADRRGNALAEVTPQPAGGRGGDSRLSGIIVKGELDLRSPLTYGLTNKDVYLLRTSFGSIAPNTIDNSVVKSTDVLVNGYADTTILQKVKDNIIVGTISKGRGAVVYFAESPTFRGYWLSTGRLLTNAIFFGVGASPRRF